MTRKNDVIGATQAIQKLVDSYKRLNPNHFKTTPLFFLDVVQAAQRVGKQKIGNKIYSICKNDDELSNLIEQARSCFICFEALKLIYSHHYETETPCPRELHNFIMACVNGEFEKPPQPKDLYESMLDILIPTLVIEGQKFTTKTGTFEIISSCLNGEAGSSDAIRKRYNKLSNKNKESC